jgi:hypothetical protein
MERRRLYDSRDIRGLQLSKKARLVEPAHGSLHQSDLPLAHISDRFFAGRSISHVSTHRNNSRRPQGIDNGHCPTMRKVSLWPVVARRDRGWAASRDRRKRTADGSACDRSPLRQRSITHSPVGGANQSLNSPAWTASLRIQSVMRIAVKTRQSVLLTAS